MLTERGTLVFAQRDEEGVIEVIDRDGIRTLYFGTGAAQSSMQLYAPATLVLEYTRSMLAALLFQPNPRKVLLIGLGGGSLARFLLQHLPQAEIDCVESRATVVEIARRYFLLPEHPRFRVHVGDGATFARDCPEAGFDLVLVDAFDGAGLHESVCTAPFYADCRRALSEGGALSVNLWVTRGSAFKDVISGIEAGFGGQILRLPVEKRANLVALGLPSPRSRKDLKSLREPARALASRFGLDFPKQLRRLEHYNGSAVRRLLNVTAR